MSEPDVKYKNVDKWVYGEVKDHQNEIKGFNLYRAESRLHS